MSMLKYHIKTVHKTIRANKNEVYMSDVDDTLIMWDLMSNSSGEAISIDLEKQRFYVRPNKPMIEMLKSKFHRGCYVVVWSQSGEEWAHAVVQALGLSEYVHLTMSKPTSYGDDLPAEAWMTNRVYLKPDHKWRNNEIPTIAVTGDPSTGPGSSTTTNESSFRSIPSAYDPKVPRRD